MMSKLLIIAMVIISQYSLIESEEFTHNSLSYGYSDKKGSNDDIISYGINNISSKYKIPKDIKIKSEECSIAGKYSSGSKSITICKEFIAYIKDTYKSLELSDYSKSVKATILFILYHEFAHAFTDIYNLPVVGNEEIAADQFAALILLEDGLLYNHLEAYRQIINNAEPLPAWDEHPDYKQQYYNLACILYGSNNEYNFKAELHERAKRCNYEYNNIKEGWSELLSKYER